MGRRYPRDFWCLDCKVDTGKINEYYFVQTSLWLRAVGSNKGMLCIGCLEERLGRLLVKADFTDCFINNLKWHGGRSLRLISRLTAS